MTHFDNPFVLAALLLLPLVPFVLRFARRRTRVSFSSIALAAPVPRTLRLRLRWLPDFFRLAALALLIFAAARPQLVSGKTKTSTEGIAIQIVLDRSGSMREPISTDGDQLTKMTVVKKALANFVLGDDKTLRGRTGDMIGLITFARYADTLSPLARVHQPIVDAANQVQPAEVRAEDGTAIGDALALAAARLKRAEEEVARSAPKDGSKPEFQIKSKVIILLTDGQNNAGEASPYDAAKLAKDWGIRLYTIGVGTGERLVQTIFGTQRMPGGDVDERMLKEIAGETGGRYYAAESPASLAQACTDIDSLEKSKIDSTQYSHRTELFGPYAAAATVFLALELLMGTTVFRRIA